MSEATLQRIMGAKMGCLVHERACGIDRTRVVSHAPLKSTSTELGLDRHEVDGSVRRSALLGLAVDIGRQLRTDGQVARALTLTVHYADRSTTTRTLESPQDGLARWGRRPSSDRDSATDAVKSQLSSTGALLVSCPAVLDLPHALVAWVAMPSVTREAAAAAGIHFRSSAARRSSSWSTLCRSRATWASRLTSRSALR
ncbi:hypothetical protein ACIA8I_31995 [Streptomyces rishiriensis]|uniref:DinB/UmuC family translesion DNA polymerase n=1 Tax=Streptomyces rishiriensis TaxID=68264 RepID=UPI003789C1BC